MCIKVPNLSLCQNCKPEPVYMKFIPIPLKQYQNHYGLRWRQEDGRGSARGPV